MNYKKKTLVVFLIFIANIMLIGRLLDKHVEHFVDPISKRDSNGYMEGCESTWVTNNNSSVIMFIHGLGGSSYAGKNQLKFLFTKYKDTVDFYLPTLPNHGISLQDHMKFSVSKTELFLKSEIENLTKNYKHVTIVGQSMGGLIVLNMLDKQTIPKTVNVVLWSPSIFLRDNTLKTRTQLKAYNLWRNYCDYDSLGCPYRSFKSVEPEGYDAMYYGRSFQVYVTPHLSTIFNLDLLIRNKIEKISQPLSVHIAKNDNRINVNDLKKALEKNKNISITIYPRGKHAMIFSNQKSKVLANIVRESRQAMGSK